MDIKYLLAASVKEHASDLHLSPNSCPIMRINGELVRIEEAAVLNQDAIRDLIYSVMDKEQQRVLETYLELDFAITIPEVASFRVNAFKQINGLAAVFRVIPNQIPLLNTIVDKTDVFTKLLQLSSGLILVTGPTGCGKSTTIAAMIDYINTTQTSHIITIEDPIEFIHQSKKSLINQRQVHRDTVTFSAALRSALREDPDVILVGELRDLETIRLALTAAETGHLVMATLHTSSAPRAVSRLIDVFPTGEKNIIRNLVSESLQAVICQALISKVAGNRVAAFEIMLGIPAIRNLIREDKIAQMYTVMQTNYEKGMCTMKQCLHELIEKGVINSSAAQESGFQRELFEN